MDAGLLVELPSVLLGEDIFCMKIKQLLFFMVLLAPTWLKSCFTPIKIDDPDHPRAQFYKAILNLDLEAIRARLVVDQTLSFDRLGELYRVSQTEYLTMSQAIDRIRPLTRKQRKKSKEKGELIIWWQGDMISAWLETIWNKDLKNRLEVVLAKRYDRRTKEENKLLKLFAKRSEEYFNAIAKCIHRAQRRCSDRIGRFDPVFQTDNPSSDPGCCIS